MSEPAPTPAHKTGDDPAARPGVHLTHKQILFVFAGLMLGMFLAALDQTVVSAALPTIVGELGGLDEITWVVTSYLLTSTVTILVWGKLSDIYGRKQMFQASIGIFLASSAFIGLSQNMWMLILGRGLQGIGAGGIMSLAFAIIGDILSPRERGKYMGLMGSVFLVSSVVGPWLGGFLTENFSWRWIFYINLPIGIPALIVTGIVLRLPFQRHKHKIDYAGTALLIVGASAMILGLVWGGQGAPWDSGCKAIDGAPAPCYELRWFPGGSGTAVPSFDAGAAALPVAHTLDSGQKLLSDWSVTGLLVAGALLLGAFLWRQAKVEHPLLPLRLFAKKDFSIASAVSFIIGAAMFGGFIFLPTYLQDSAGVAPTQSGLLLLPMVLGIMPFMTASGIVISKTGRYKWWPLVGVPVAMAGMGMLSRIDSGTSSLYLGVGMFLLGAGIGMVMQVMVLVAQNSLDVRDMGIGTAANNFMRSMGSVFGVSLFGVVFADRLRAALPQIFTAARENGVDPVTVARAFRSSPEAIKGFPDPVRIPVVDAVAHGVGDIFLFALPVMLLAWALLWFLREVPLRSTRNVGAAAMEGAEGLLPSGGDRPVLPAVAATRGLPQNALARVEPRPGDAVYEAARRENGAAAPRHLPPVRAFADRPRPTGPLTDAHLADLHRRIDRLPDPRKRGR
ncbi:MAG: MDR family MFS transporter [Thermoplasmatota archaeon]|nr:MFS transporter [Halobacteriales archaeon]